MNYYRTNSENDAKILLIKRIYIYKTMYLQWECYFLHFLFDSSHSILSSVWRWYETGVASRLLVRGAGVGLADTVFLRGSGCGVDGLGVGDGGIFWRTVPSFCSCFKHCNPSLAVNLELGSFFQHDVMTRCQVSHGCCVPSMWMGRKSHFITSSRSMCCGLLAMAAPNAISPYQSSQRTYPKLYISALQS